MRIWPFSLIADRRYQRREVAKREAAELRKEVEAHLERAAAAGHNVSFFVHFLRLGGSPSVVAGVLKERGW